jgi:hypothetical protein
LHVEGIENINSKRLRPKKEEKKTRKRKNREDNYDMALFDWPGHPSHGRK